MEKNIEMMKKIIEQKKKKGKNIQGNLKPKKVIGHSRQGSRQGNGGGLFDK
ncbi:hypothetical protein [Clostridium sp. BJN0001]|uniref:hypothetical protein n=1 Tax=Clostridium sp. BJN0001 TaxID=2930219 RepID=UPI001FCFB639|nr:hypothetical protein [Clostridium sp. BJN0001]